MRVEVLGPLGEPLGALDCPSGERLLDAMDDARLRVPIGCRSATCGVCLVEVVCGAEGLFPPDAIERLALEDLASTPHERLTCRVTISADRGLLQLRLRSAP